jgi:hypothetical protein
LAHTPFMQNPIPFMHVVVEGTNLQVEVQHGLALAALPGEHCEPAVQRQLEQQADESSQSSPGSTRPLPHVEVCGAQQ